MIYRTPELNADDEEVLKLIAEQKERLKINSDSSPGRWFGSLRRSAFARAIQGSNSIEGYNASLDDAMAIVEDEPIGDERTETARAIKGYRDALTYIGQAAHDPYFEFSRQFLKSLHFMMIGHEMSNHPGQWRPSLDICCRFQNRRNRIYGTGRRNGEPADRRAGRVSESR